jgi:hypothetical protein
MSHIIKSHHTISGGNNTKHNNNNNHNHHNNNNHNNRVNRVNCATVLRDLKVLINSVGILPVFWYPIILKLVMGDTEYISVLHQLASTPNATSYYGKSTYRRSSIRVMFTVPKIMFAVVMRHILNMIVNESDIYVQDHLASDSHRDNNPTALLSRMSELDTNRNELKTLLYTLDRTKSTSRWIYLLLTSRQCIWLLHIITSSLYTAKLQAWLCLVASEHIPRDSEAMRAVVEYQLLDRNHAISLTSANMLIEVLYKNFNRRLLTLTKALDLFITHQRRYSETDPNVYVLSCRGSDYSLGPLNPETGRPM